MKTAIKLLAALLLAGALAGCAGLAMSPDYPESLSDPRDE